MILYVTKETFERFKLKMPEDMISPLAAKMAQAVIDRESGDAFLEWGGKLFYFDRRKCLQVTHFASRLTFFLVDIKLADLPDVGQMIAYYLFDLYDGDAQMKALLERYFKDAPALVFSKLTNRSAIASLNYTQRSFLQDGYRMYEFIRDGILHTRELNQEFNRSWPVSRTVNGKKDYYFGAELFRQQLIERYQEKPRVLQ